MTEEHQTQGEIGGAVQEHKEAGEVLHQILLLMGHELKVEVIDENDRLRLNIVGDTDGELIGNKGEILDALQFLTGRIIGRKISCSRPIVIDNGGYRERRVEALTQLAHRLGEKVRRSGKILAVNPMSAHDRRVIHMALRESPGISTRSEGEGIFRRLLIIPEKE